MIKKISLAVFALLAIVLLGAGCAPSYQAPVAPTPQTGTPVINSNTEYYPPSNTNAGTPSVNINVVVPTNANVTPPPTTVTVDIRNFAFDPAELNISVGTTVRWENYDSVSHQIAGTGFGSNALPKGGEYSFTFNQAGTYDYHCAIHPSMIGKIIVK